MRVSCTYRPSIYLYLVYARWVHKGLPAEKRFALARRIGAVSKYCSNASEYDDVCVADAVPYKEW